MADQRRADAMTSGGASPGLAVRERPIIMSGESVRAVLAGAKTQTRRVIMTPRSALWSRTKRAYLAHCWTVGEHPGGGWMAVDVPDADLSRFSHIDSAGFPCPYGRPGDRLWVRETFRLLYDGYGDRYSLLYGDTTERAFAPNDAATDLIGREKWQPVTGDDQHAGRWRSPIHMPRWASRLTLEVTGVRVERVQDISDDDAKAEGCPAPAGYTYSDGRDCYRDTFRDHWNALNLPRGYPWEANPWVFVIEFKKVVG